MSIIYSLILQFICLVDSVDVLPDAATLFAYRQATIDSIRNYEVESYCATKKTGHAAGEDVFGPLTYRRSGDSVMYVNASDKAYSQDLVTPEQSKSLESTLGRVPKFGIVDKPSVAHYCRDPWYFSRYVTKDAVSKKHISFPDRYSKGEFKTAKVEKIDANIFRVVFGKNGHVNMYEFDRSVGYHFRRLVKEFTADEVGGRKVDGMKVYSEVQFEDYVFVNKIPIVKTIREHTELNGDTIDIVMKLSKICVNSPDVDRKMTLDFPVGLMVDDYVDQVSYKVGKNGERLNVEPIQITRVMPPGSSPSVTLTPTLESPSYPTYSWVLPSSIGLLVVAALVGWRLRRGRGDS